jgi:hypothetical protein
VPEQLRELAGGRDDRDRMPTPSADALVERAQRSEERIAVSAASTRTCRTAAAPSLLMCRCDRAVAGLAHAEIEGEVADEALGRGEAVDVAAGGAGLREEHCDGDHADPGDGELPNRRLLRDPGVDALRELATETLVVGPGATSMHAPSLLGSSFGLVTVPNPPAVKKLTAARTARCSPGRRRARRHPGVLGFGEDVEATRSRILAAARMLIDRGVGTIVLGCMPMAFLDIDDELCAELGVPAINPAKVELGVAEALVRARLRPSRLTNPLPPKLAGDTTLAELQIVRTFGSDVKAQVRAAIERMAAGVAAAHRCTATVTYEEGYGPVVNDAEVSALVRSTRLRGVADRARARHGRRGLLRLPAGRARLFLRGVGGGGDAFPHHHPRFAVDEEAIGVAVDVFVATTLDFLHRRN